MNQLNLLDAIEARDAAMAQVEGGADARFLLAAYEALQKTCRTLPEFTTDDVAANCSITPREPRAWGPVMKGAAKDGLIEATNQYRKSASRTCHARPKMIWRVKAQ